MLIINLTVGEELFYMYRSCGSRLTLRDEEWLKPKGIGTRPIAVSGILQTISDQPSNQPTHEWLD